MKLQHYETLFVATACVAFGVVSLWKPGVIRWPTTPRGKRWFGIGAIVIGLASVAVTLLGT